MADQEKNISARRVFAQQLRRYRNLKKISQEELASRSGLHRTYISSVERGERNISIDNIEKIAGALKVRVADFFSNVDEANLIGLQWKVSDSSIADRMSKPKARQDRAYSWIEQHLGLQSKAKKQEKPLSKEEMLEAENAQLRDLLVLTLAKVFEYENRISSKSNWLR